ncbi:DNA-binding NarL/FixJ family response regulator [Enterobacter sp. BIGb0383]|uniref:LuxR C-terminal-related transcriptional regulator n=1 Tax=unclassified Enterobacter TaxID=2608935 RepID=UPI000F48EA06|nr:MULTISPECIES: LuxR C-terminal-related transcriptional regulator [unclassified Enterobacter]ROP60140.1 DNA-binding NarL/FixJ family response regulator [Enterobacter sp. BIGb0383]ROS08393.1 DNA-binding NarL/FixJ family response regulator [Enterobacter sp. BIGb0359]
MFKILLIDRCNFSRSGLEMWLDHVNCFSSPLLISGINSLLLAKEHIVQWQPNLVIADLHGFANEPHQLQLISSLMSACENQSLVILLQSGDDPRLSQYRQHLPVWATLSKRIRLDELTRITDAALRSRPEFFSTQIATTLLTRQEEKVLSLWMEGQSNNMIARSLSIRGKTVYTYKRNIRMKLHMDNRFSPFALSGKVE